MQSVVGPTERDYDEQKSHIVRLVKSERRERTEKISGSRHFSTNTALILLPLQFLFLAIFFPLLYLFNISPPFPFIYVIWLLKTTNPETVNNTILHFIEREHIWYLYKTQYRTQNTIGHIKKQVKEWISL